jgi:hypothetical protein
VQPNSLIVLCWAARTDGTCGYHCLSLHGPCVVRPLHAHTLSSCFAGTGSKVSQLMRCRPKQWLTSCCCVALLQVIVGLQTDEPLKRAIKPQGGVGIVQNALKAYGYELPKELELIYTNMRKTHNQGACTAALEHAQLIDIGSWACRCPSV